VTLKRLAVIFTTLLCLNSFSMAHAETWKLAAVTLMGRTYLATDSVRTDGSPHLVSFWLLIKPISYNVMNPLTPILQKVEQHTRQKAHSIRLLLRMDCKAHMLYEKQVAFYNKANKPLIYTNMGLSHSIQMQHHSLAELLYPDVCQGR
jgi:hypothetical protein